MTKCEILAELQRSIPAMADYGQVNQYRFDHVENQRLFRFTDILLEDSSSEPSLLENVRLGLEEW